MDQIKDLDGDQFVVRAITGDRIRTVTVPLSSIEECRLHISFLESARRISDEREAHRQASDAGYQRDRETILGDHGVDIWRNDPPVTHRIFRIKLEEVV